MTEPQLSYLFETALLAILEATREIARIYKKGHVHVVFKSDQSPVTQADKISSDIISKHLIKTGIPVICEEKGLKDYAERKTWDHFWLVDPLDGTKEFIKRNGQFTINIALVQANKPILGLISIPTKDLLYWGDYQHGAFKIKIRKIRETSYPKLIEKAIQLPKKCKHGKLTIMVSRSHLDDQTLRYIDILKLKGLHVKTKTAGSALKFCYIAEGKADLYLRFSPTMEWDTAAGHAIVEASGANISSLPSYNLFAYNKPDLRNNGFIVYKDENLLL
ncbi:MAG TPA: 3'(2'),5'-bisphosphate nucleotidase CysQ [Bacteroidales bacterium]